MAARRGLALFTAAAVTGALAAAVPGSSAGPAASKSDTRVASVAEASTLTAGRYVNVLSEPGATRYDSRTTPDT